jgi:hypothetical protein
MNERWLPVPGYEGSYLVSDRGRVASLRHSDGPRREPYMLKPSKCAGRPVVSLCGGRPPRRESVGRLVLLAFVGPCPPGMECCHANDDPWDNRLENLRWDTRRANVADARRNGRLALGERRHNAQLRAAAIPHIREAYAAGVKSPDIASRYGVAPHTVRDAARGLTWAHVPGAVEAPPKPAPKPPKPRQRWPRLLEWRGETLRVTEWARRLGIDAATIVRRIGLGWSAEEALTASPEDYKQRRLCAQGKAGCRCRACKPLRAS